MINKTILTIEIAVDETNIVEKYPNYKFNFGLGSEPNAFIEHLTDGLETKHDINGKLINHLDEWGYSIRVLTRDEAKLLDV